MTQKKYQTVEVEGKKMTFNFDLFQEMFLHMADKEGIKRLAYEKVLADVLFVNEATVHNWRQKRNCPGSIELIGEIARYWKIPVENLLVEVAAEDLQEAEKNAASHKKEEDVQMDTVRKFTDREKDAVQRIYDKFLDYMIAFKETTGFQASMDLPEDEYGPRQDELYYQEIQLKADLKKAVLREYIDLKDTVYDALKYLVDNGVESIIYKEKTAAGELDYSSGSLVIDEDDEEEEEEMLAQLKEEEEKYFLTLYVGTLELFRSIIDPYL